MPGSWVLIRPDGYYAASGASLTGEALRRALSPLGLKAAPAVRDAVPTPQPAAAGVR